MIGMANTTWCADGRCLLPIIMIECDTAGTKDFDLFLYEELDRLTVIWENIPLLGNPDSCLTLFAMYDDGDVMFSAEELEYNNFLEIGHADLYYVNKIANAWHKNSRRYTWLPEVHAQPACPQYTSCCNCPAHSLN